MTSRLKKSPPFVIGALQLPAELVHDVVDLQPPLWHLGRGPGQEEDHVPRDPGRQVSPGRDPGRRGLPGQDVGRRARPGRDPGRQERHGGGHGRQGGPEGGPFPRGDQAQGEKRKTIISV